MVVYQDRLFYRICLFTYTRQNSFTNIVNGRYTVIYLLCRLHNYEPWVVSSQFLFLLDRKAVEEDDVDVSKLQPTITLTADTLKSHRDKLSTDGPLATKAIIIEDNSIDGGKPENTVTKV